ncbi:prolyl oligopeptidase family serine peptidase [Brevundimonas sp.]|uniref:S9 family peptidase n=1 Tax=Brevundimonas sp. TaxID=1871086 RepID=UPI0028AFE22B|nr:prolyl oligopeptidase family serine peptidase [Brevundimonas sp.]
MWKSLIRLAAAGIVALCLVGVGRAEPLNADGALTVDDLLGLEAFGRAAISPDGKWSVYEKRAGYDSMSRVESNGRSAWAIMELWLADLRSDGSSPQRLLEHEGLGLQLVAWSPSSAKLLITRLQGDVYEYGVLSLEDRLVKWTGLTPDLPLGGATAVWLSDDDVLLAVRPDRSLPLALGYDRASIRRRVEAWERTARGILPSRTVIDAREGVVLSETPEPRQALIRFDTTNGATEVLAEGRIADFALSPDAKRVALVLREEPIPLGEPELLHMEDDRRRRLTLIDLQKGVQRRAAGLDVAPHLLRWSPDSNNVLIWARGDHAGWDDGHLVKAGFDGVETYATTDLKVGSSAKVVVAGVQADWLGRFPVLYARASASQRHDWYLLQHDRAPQALTSTLAEPPDRITAAGPQQLYAIAEGRYWVLTTTGARALLDASPAARFDLREAKIFDLTMGRRARSNEAPRTPWSAAVDGEGRLIVLFPDQAAPLGLDGGSNDRVLAISERATVALRPTGLMDTLIVRSPGMEREVDRVNARLANLVPIEAKPVAHKDVNGLDVTSWVFLPRRDIRGVIVTPYPGWADNLARLDPLTMTYSFRPEVFLAAGYAVLSPWLPGDLPTTERGEVYTRSVDLAVDAVVAAHPELPQDRMALWGHSFGGYAALEIATRSSRFRSYIASSAYSDMQGVWGEFDALGRIQPEKGMFFRFNQGWTEVGQGALGAPPWATADRYALSSPFLRANDITRPILFLTADMDFTPFTQAERMFSAILRNHGEARLVTYWGEKHLTWSPANIRDRYQQILDWLEHTLDGPDLASEVRRDVAPTAEPMPPAPPP